MTKQTDNAVEAHENGLRDFFTGLGTVVDRAVKAHENGLRDFFAGLGTAVDIARQAQEKLDRIAATQFSVFKYFKVLEPNLSRIFADLLDPAGSHGQGDRFLRLFLEEIRRSLDDTLRRGFPSSGFHEFKSYTECWTDKGRKIDIVLEMPDDNHWIGIENKPWAREQKNPLLSS